ncbi:MAG UNVERIFIED_CONTAM: ATP-grasp domain-containing protein [Anaerolineae bacterium]|jgi:biotin carboxylase
MPSKSGVRLTSSGDRQSYYLLEQFIPGEVFHVDTLYQQGKPTFLKRATIRCAPMSVYQGGGVFMSRIIERKKGDAPKLRKINAEVNKALGMVNGVTHTEFIKAHHDHSFYFLESAARWGVPTLPR